PVPPVHRPGGPGDGHGQHGGAARAPGGGDRRLGAGAAGEVPAGAAHAQGRAERGQRRRRGHAAVRRGRHHALLHKRGGPEGARRVQGEAPPRVRQVPAPPVTGRAFAIPLRTRFRGVTVREGMLVRGAAGWGEFSPFAEYGPAECARWWAACHEAAEVGWPAPVRDAVPVNATVPAVGPEEAARLVASSGCATAKVKVAERGQTEADDLARVEAVRDAIGPAGKVRVDVNGAWDVDTAVRMIRLLDRFDLEYVEQP